MRRRSALLPLIALTVVAMLAIGVRSAGAAPVSADAVLLELPDAVWDDKFNPEAMAAAFGTNWETQEFEAVQADEGEGGLFAPHVRMIWIEGSDGSTTAAKAFVEANEAELKAFVARGGSLFINSATNEEIFIDYDGRSVGRDGSEVKDVSEEVEAVAPSHPIFNGPATPNATFFTGNSFAHGGVTGPGLTPLMTGLDSGATVLAEYASGAGLVMIGAFTAVEFQSPEEEAKSLRINILDYLFAASKAGPEPSPADTTPADTTKPSITFKGLPKSCVEHGFRFRIVVRDGGGVGPVRVKLGKRLVRKANGKGAKRKLVKVRVADGRLTHPGRYRIRAIARDVSGNVKRKGASFRVCG